MTRAIAVVTCLIASLFLIPIQGECSEPCEYEPETEVECCVMSFSETQSEMTVTVAGIRPVIRINIIPTPFQIAPSTKFISIKTLPVRILHCVFRE